MRTDITLPPKPTPNLYPAVSSAEDTNGHPSLTYSTAKARLPTVLNP